MSQGWDTLKSRIASDTNTSCLTLLNFYKKISHFHFFYSFTFLHFHSSTLAHLHFYIASDSKTPSISPAQLPTNIQVLQEDLTLSLFTLSLFTLSSLYTCIFTLPLPLLLPPKAPLCPLLTDRQLLLIISLFFSFSLSLLFFFLLYWFGCLKRVEREVFAKQRTHVRHCEAIHYETRNAHIQVT